VIIPWSSSEATGAGSSGSASASAAVAAVCRAGKHGPAEPQGPEPACGSLRGADVNWHGKAVKQGLLRIGGSQHGDRISTDATNMSVDRPLAAASPPSSDPVLIATVQPVYSDAARVSYGPRCTDAVDLTQNGMVTGRLDADGTIRTPRDLLDAVLQGRFGGVSLNSYDGGGRLVGDYDRLAGRELKVRRVRHPPQAV